MKYFITFFIIYGLLLILSPEQKYSRLPTHNVNYHIEGETGILSISGIINQDSYNVTANAFAYFNNLEIKNILVNLNSEGGNVKNGIGIASKILKATESGSTVTVYVGHKEICASMCTAIFAAGGERKAEDDSIWLFHSPRPIQSISGLNDLQKTLFLSSSRKYMLALYDHADETFTTDILLQYINSNKGDELKVSGKDLKKLSKTWLNE